MYAKNHAPGSLPFVALMLIALFGRAEECGPGPRDMTDEDYRGM